ncbi:MAG TPA: hypothetical protein VE988_03325, partial [Gemmataceae bacterium]|nr:hypothetical protein [Gemmataceae bacterium]
MPGITLRGLHLISGAENPNVFVTGHCPGVVLDGLEMTAKEDCAGVELLNVKLTDEDKPVIIQNCTLRGLAHGFTFTGGDFLNKIAIPLPLGRIVLRNNEIVECGQSIHLV